MLVAVVYGLGYCYIDQGCGYVFVGLIDKKEWFYERLVVDTGERVYKRSF